MTEYKYAATARWTEARRGIVAGSDTSQIDFAAPPEFQGEAGKWTPEHLFMAALTSCFVTTFRAIAEFSKFAFAGLEVTAEGTLDKVEGGYRFTHVTVRPRLVLPAGADLERGTRLLEKAERGCLISRSITAQIKLEPAVVALTGAEVSS